MSPVFDPKRFLLRRGFLIHEEKTMYASVGFYSARIYQPLVEFGGSRIKPFILMEQHVANMVDWLPRICEAVCKENLVAHTALSD